MQNAVAEIVQNWGRLDLVVHTAGIASKSLLVHESIASWDATVQVHLTGALFCFRASHEVMRHQKSGQLIFLGSHAGLHGAPGQVSYATAKAALHGLTQELARIGGPENIRVNLVLPGVMESPLIQGVSPATRLGWLRSNSLGRQNRPEEVAQFIVTLSQMQNVSGQIFPLDSRF
jgi:3-oxoacyl-[acyl-carrier protein] reductase